MSQTAAIVTSVKPLDPALDPEAAQVLARCPALGNLEAAQDAIAGARDDAEASLFGVIVNGALAGAYLLRKVHLMNEIVYLAIGPEHERQGYGKMCLYDALLRSGRRPLVVEAGDSNVGFFKACGFKLVGKRRGPDDSTRYRLGWHAPLPKPAGATTATPC